MSPIVSVSHAVSYSPIGSIMSHNVSCCLIMFHDIVFSHSVSYSLMSHDVSCCLIMSHSV